MINIVIQKLVPEAKLPHHATEWAAGYDLYPIEDYVIQPGERHAYKTGIAVAIPNHVYGRIAPRSGLAFKAGIDVLAGVIDADYRQEVMVILINLGKEPWSPPKDDEGKFKPIAQMIFEPYFYADIMEAVSLPPPESSRDGGLGSTDNKKKQITATPLVMDTSPLTTMYNKLGGVQIRERYSDEVKRRQTNES